jgi:acid phosphatase
MRTGQRRRCRLTIEGLESRQMLAALPLPEHVVVVIEENHDYSQIVGSTSAPYINSLAQQGALMTDSTAIEHPSQPNYLDLFSGSNQGVVDDNRPAGLPFTTPNLGAELQAANLSFVGYSESLPTAGFDGDSYTSVAGQNQYQRKHNPWTDFINDPVGVNQMPSSVNQPFSSFPTDFARLPAVAIVVPNEQNDMHDGTVQQGDTWLKNNVDGYVQWAKNHNSLLVVTWDENDSSPGNHITTIFAGPMVQPGQYGEPVNHFNVLRTLEDMYRLPDAGASAGAAPITDIWTAPTVTASQKYVTAVYQDVLGRGPDLAGLVHWSSLLDQGTANSSVAEAIGHSDEYYGNFVIKPDYLNLLGRPADAAGVTYWTRRMQNGLTSFTPRLARTSIPRPTPTTPAWLTPTTPPTGSTPFTNCCWADWPTAAARLTGTAR